MGSPRESEPGEGQTVRLDGQPGASGQGQVSIVAGYAHDEVADHALITAADLAARLGAAVHTVHTIDLIDYPVDPDSSTWEDDARATLAEERDRVDTVLTAAGVPWTYYATQGNPVALLCRLAAEHNALCSVVGTHGETPGERLTRLLRGRSVSHGLLRASDRPVLLVPPAPPTRVPRGAN
ncbi:Nucleotide-binding universal stress protein, UspA family [Pseudonocardia ammonioxydans]|uniref:Nucleotide-binding universal stress protein, UspA family n=1 Tax=Pseudonocardia ammonioxydans TaxID=260086 RepID=A0A1I5IH51_PSUAM|nr:universal stress protein [Pseudonocardia ammonioxydans]SFO59401.1 Nucleotide-binding universal stress protein, UspA family [Pseudonocardia ammonioxydans]